MENSTLSPVSVSMLATIIVSVRVPSRASEPSEPSSMTLTRGRSFHGSSGSSPTTDVGVAPPPLPPTTPPELKTLSTASTWAVM
ncbi:hypothetical protein BJF80_13875 [Serinicoccus sp. CUA-874]|uniref:hypothetical protein n=1 Tax=Serinicoccus sp. CUA-874 TaxID=1517939 RepID=UPI000963BAB0|nr:hypothetical protein [Serinicoccus sp. CUA-874]OLT18930.1 hypothetical protein BJF80_13875 [Serinicoccus sp. CUA-874]